MKRIRQVDFSRYNKKVKLSFFYSRCSSRQESRPAPILPMRMQSGQGRAGEKPALTRLG